MIAYKKDFLFEIKSVTDEGSFTGVLSVYNVVDLGGDLVETGAFGKTLQESGGVIPCLYQHNDPIGMLNVHDTGSALEVKGQLVMDLCENGTPRVPEAYKALALMKAGVVRGMSIGYRTIKSKIIEGVRHLKELKLLEGSVVTFPMLPVAQVTSVKKAAGATKDDFLTELDEAQTFQMRYMMYCALGDSLDSIVWDNETTDAEKLTAVDESIQQFHDAYLAFLPKLFAAWAGYKSEERREKKAGRMISAANMAILDEQITVLAEAVTKLQALRDAGAAGTSTEAAGTQRTEAAKQDPVEPDGLHSLAGLRSMIGEISWN